MQCLSCTKLIIHCYALLLRCCQCFVALYNKVESKKISTLIPVFTAKCQRSSREINIIFKLQALAAKTLCAVDNDTMTSSCGAVSSLLDVLCSSLMALVNVAADPEQNKMKRWCWTRPDHHIYTAAPEWSVSFQSGLKMRRIVAECRGADELPARPRLAPRSGRLTEAERSITGLLAASTALDAAEANWQDTGRKIKLYKRKRGAVSPFY